MRVFRTVSRPGNSWPRHLRRERAVLERPRSPCENPGVFARKNLTPLAGGRIIDVRGDFTDLLDRAGYHIQLSRGEEARGCQTRVFYLCNRSLAASAFGCQHEDDGERPAR